MYFDPKNINGQVLIDGGVIANEPAFYAYIFSQEILNKTNIRVHSIGTGVTQSKDLDITKITLITWLELVGSFITSIAQNTHDYLMSRLAKDYFRFQAIMTDNLGLDSIKKKDIKVLLQLGADVVTQRRSDIEIAVK